MPLPLPHLDTRRWADLVDEARSLIPLYAPDWTDHNASDPGITLLELFAFLTEQQIFRANQIPERHRLKFLALAGYLPRPPQAARTTLALALKPAQPALTLPAGLSFAGSIPGAGSPTQAGVLFRTCHPLQVLPIQLQSVQVFDGAAWSDQTSNWRERQPFAAWGSNPAPAGPPEAQPALYLGFDQALPVGSPASLWLEFAGRSSGPAEAARIRGEAAEAAADCQPLDPGWACPPGAAAPQPSPAGDAAALPPHHSVRTAWEFYDGSAWQALPAAALNDATRSFTLSGRVVVTPAAPMAALAVGAVLAPAYYLRCRMLSGPPDAAPRLNALFLNAVELEQAQSARYPLPIAAGVLPPAGFDPQVGQTGPLSLTIDALGQISALAFGPGVSGPLVLVEGYIPAQPAVPGQLIATLVLAGLSNGYPLQQLQLPGAPLNGGSAQIWTVEPGGLVEWSQRADLDAAQAADNVFSLESASGLLRFGDGQRGRIPPPGAAQLAQYETTTGAAGNLPADSTWQLAGADDLLNRALLGLQFQAIVDALAPAANPLPALGGADAEESGHAAGRAAEALYAHERLVELAGAHTAVTLDQISLAEVSALAAPERATTLLDSERLALNVPGVSVARARAWAGLDPNAACLQAPGTLAVIILPELPAGRPVPTPGLLQVVRAYLTRRRIVGTRLVVAGPQYLEVSVSATVQLKAGANPARVQAQVIDQLNRFLDPLRGGPAGLGWPFGRDVYQAEVLQIIDAVPGVDHVNSLELIPDQGEPQCDNLCVGPTGLACPGQHRITTL